MEQEKKNWFLSLSCSPLVIWKGRVVTTRQEQLGTVETQPSTENVSSKTREGNTSCFQMLSLRQFFTQQKAAGSNLSLADILCRAQNNNWLHILSDQIACDHYCELPALESRSQWSLHEQRDRGHLRVSAISWRLSSLQQTTGQKTNRDLEKPVWSWGLREWVRDSWFGYAGRGKI